MGIGADTFCSMTSSENCMEKENDVLINNNKFVNIVSLAKQQTKYRSYMFVNIVLHAKQQQQLQAIHYNKGMLDIITGYWDKLWNCNSAKSGI